MAAVLALAVTSPGGAEPGAIPKPHIKNPLAMSGYLATVLASPRPLKREAFEDHEIEFTLQDGTRARPFSRPRPSPSP